MNTIIVNIVITRKFKIAVVPGDGIGGEVMATLISILKAFELPFQYDEYKIGESRYLEAGMSITIDDLYSLKNSDAILFGALTTPLKHYPGYKSPILTIRKDLNLFANMRPIANRQKNVDIVIFRENTEDLYVQDESLLDNGNIAIAKKIITRNASQEIINTAIDYYKKHQRKKITIVHKANVLKVTDGLFQSVCREELEKENIPYDEEFIDCMAYKMVKYPESFDLIVTSNMYGDILSDLGGVLVDNIGMLPSVNIGSYCNLYEPVHGSAPDIAGQDIVNPYAMILSGALMLNDLGFLKESLELRKIISHFIDQNITAISVGGKYRNTQIRDLFIENMQVFA